MDLRSVPIFITISIAQAAVGIDPICSIRLTGQFFLDNNFSPRVFYLYLELTG